MLRILKLIALASVLAGCATQTPSVPSATYGTNVVPASFASALAYPERLRPVPGDAAAWRWRDPDVDFRQYQSLLIERIRIKLDPSSSAVDPNELKALTDYFHAAIDKAVSPPYTIAQAPGRGVLRMRITIVDLVSTKPEVSFVVLLTPYATIPDMLSGAATGKPVGTAPYLGQTGIAVQFIDSAADRVVAEFTDIQYGRKYAVDSKAGLSTAITSGVSNYLDAYSSWAYTQQAFDRWSQQLRRRLDQINGRASG
ncbi:MAG: DUF3313 domain-containing protein [Betaproteobacteria bacterium]